MYNTVRGGHRSGGITTLGNTLTFTPSAFNWLPGETVRATLTTTLQSTSGQKLAVARVFQFTTAVGSSGRGKLLPPATTPEVAVGNTPYGAYTVVVTDAQGCSSLPSSLVVVTATLSPLASSSLAVHPNPNPDGRLTVTIQGYQQPTVLTVLTMLGQEVSSYRLAAMQAQQVLDLRAPSAGLYLLRVTIAGGTDVRRFVRE